MKLAYTPRRGNLRVCRKSHSIRPGLGAFGLSARPYLLLIGLLTHPLLGFQPVSTVQVEMFRKRIPTFTTECRDSCYFVLTFLSF